MIEPAAKRPLGPRREHHGRERGAGRKPTTNTPVRVDMWVAISVSTTG